MLNYLKFVCDWMYVIEYVNFGECVVIFDYGDGLNGLSYWGELNLEWVLCKVGN